MQKRENERFLNQRILAKCFSSISSSTVHAFPNSDAQREGESDDSDADNPHFPVRGSSYKEYRVVQVAALPLMLFKLLLYKMTRKVITGIIKTPPLENIGFPNSKLLRLINNITKAATRSPI